jgi:hypothetical protein
MNGFVNSAQIKFSTFAITFSDFLYSLYTFLRRFFRFRLRFFIHLSPSAYGHVTSFYEGKFLFA